MLTLLLSLVSGVALAQQGDAPAPQPAQDAGPTAPAAAPTAAPELAPAGASDVPAMPALVLDAPSQAELHEMEARALYQVGLQLVINGQYSEARSVFIRVESEYADTPTAASATQQVALLGTLQTKQRGLRDPAATARAELIIEQTLVAGLLLGVALPGSTWQPSQPAGPVLLSLTGATAGGLGANWLAKEYQPTSGQVMALFTGELLGAANGFGLSAIAPPRDFRGLYRETLAGTLVGAGAGLAAGYYLSPDAGQVAAVNAGAVWGSYATAMSFVYLRQDNPRWVAARMVGGMDAGAALGALSAHYYPMSRGRVNVVNLSGLAGTAVAGGVFILADFYGSFYNEKGIASLFLAGSAVGLGAGVFLTRNMGTSSDTAAIPGGALVGVNGREVGFGVPLPMLTVDRDGELAGQVRLAAGVF